MAHPFGQQPRLQDYLRFLETQGCRWRTRGSVGRDGRTYREVIVTNSTGQHYIIVMPDPDERVSIYLVESVRRRLGVTAPYVPPQPPTPIDDPGPED